MAQREKDELEKKMSESVTRKQFSGLRKWIRPNGPNRARTQGVVRARSRSVRLSENNAEGGEQSTEGQCERSEQHRNTSMLLWMGTPANGRGK